MSKNLILITSIISLILAGIYTFFSLSYTPKGILFYTLIIVWIAVVYIVFSDAKKRGKPTIFTGLALLLGGIGGLIYYFTISKESDDQLSSIPQQGINESSRKSLLIFSSILAVIFGLAFVMTFPLRDGSEFNWPLTITMGILLLACIGSIFYAKNKK